MNFLDNASLWIKINFPLHSLIFLSLIAFSILNFKRIIKGYKRLKTGKGKQILVLLILVLLVASSLRFVSSNIYPTFISTWEYLQTSKSIVENGNSLLCYEGYYPRCKNGREANNHPAMFTVIHGLLYLVTGISLKASLFLSLFIGIFTIFLSFWSLYKYTDNPWAGLITSSFLAVLPLHIFGNKNANLWLGLLSVFSTFICILALTIEKEYKDWKSFGFFIASLVFSISFRQENVILVPFLVLLSFKESSKEELIGIFKNKRKLILILVFSVLLIAPLRNTISFWFVKGYANKTFSASYIIMNFKRLFKILNWLFLPISFFLIILIPFLLKNQKRKLTIALGWIISYILLYLSFKNGPSPRYLMNLIPPFSFLLGISSRAFHDILRNKNYQRFPRKLFFISIVILVLIGGLPAKIKSKVPFKRYSIKKVKDLSKQTEKDSWIVFPTTNAMWGFYFVQESRRAIYGYSLSQRVSDNASFLLKNDIYLMELVYCEKVERLEKMCGLMIKNSELEDRKGKTGLWKLNLKNKTGAEKLAQSLESTYSEN